MLLAFVFVFGTLELVSLRFSSATWDEPGNLAAGYAALSAGDYRPAIEHPPLARLWAALPLTLMSDVKFNSQSLDAQRPEAVAFPGPFALGHRFLYETNAGDRVLYPARCMIVILGVLLGAMVFFWAAEWRGFRAGVIALTIYTLEPNLAAHGVLVTTDLAVTCFMFGTVYFLWRTARNATGGNLAGLTLFFTSALLTKFSALLLVPIVGLLLIALAWQRRTLTSGSVLRIGALLVAATWAGVWLAYGFRYAPSATPGWLFSLHTYPPIVSAVPTLASIVGWIDGHHLLPNAYIQGFLHGQGLLLGKTGFLAGKFSDEGWWYYFPAAILMKTPLAILALVFAGIWMWVKKRQVFNLDGEAFVVVPIIVFLGVAMTSDLNIGLRHVLPIYPFLILLAATAGDAIVSQRAQVGRLVLGAALVAGLAEGARAYPGNLAFFNTLVGGPSNGFRYLADSNVDWGQDLKTLKRWMDRQGVDHVNLAYFGTAEPAFYGIRSTPIWGTTIPGLPSSRIGPPSLPGYVAISVTLLDGVPFAPAQRDFYKVLRDQAPVADLGGSIRVYWVERPFW
ncbi:MAG TPA: glycosyltransferase family 39 protein [Vicinamibacterales bacterium]|nr:glycosyltransferase family 39 protein [Vicinamibacterales bacterium]